MDLFHQMQVMHIFYKDCCKITLEVTQRNCVGYFIAFGNLILYLSIRLFFILRLLVCVGNVSLDILRSLTEDDRAILYLTLGVQYYLLLWLQSLDKTKFSEYANMNNLIWIQTDQPIEYHAHYAQALWNTLVRAYYFRYYSATIYAKAIAIKIYRNKWYKGKEQHWLFW